MTKLEELQIDLDSHKKSLARLRDPDFRAKAHRGRIYDPMYDMNPNVLIPSYVKIIESIEKEIASLTPNKVHKKTAPKDPAGKGATKRVSKTKP